MDNPLPATQQFLREKALDALRRCSGTRKNMCDVVAGEFAHSLETEFGYTTHAPMRAPFTTTHGTSTHFVALIPAAETSFASGPGYVIVDPTVKQFAERVEEQLPEVAILPPGDSRMAQWYTSVERP